MLNFAIFSSIGFYIGYRYLPPGSKYPDIRDNNEKIIDALLVGSVGLISGAIVDYCSNIFFSV